MDIIAEFRKLVPLEDFDGIPDAWVSSEPNPIARLVFIARPDGQALFQVNAKHETSWEDVNQFVHFARANMQKLAAATPMIAVPGLRLPHYGFDSAIAVLPAAADLTPSEDEDLNQRIYGLCPGWECEVSMTESESLAFRRYRRELQPSNWSRDPKPYIAVRFGFERQGEPDVTSDSPIVTDLGNLEAALHMIAEADAGWIECKNWRAQAVSLEFQRGDPTAETALKLLRKFVTTGG
ncbi:hypothetical protein [Nocardia sp. NPDC048505]|uniref:hypothetical protein n=1 Tax=unclassified Nocardia TaxID=2637762 RepID=UPI0033CAAA2B